MFYEPRGIRSGRIGKFEHTGKTVQQTSEMERLLQLELSLCAQAKRVLLQIATRPLLSVEQLAWLMHEHPDRVSRALQVLLRAGLVKRLSHHRTHRYLLSFRGTRYEAAEAGFGRAVKRYLRRVGGRSGLKRLAFHLEHTIATNDFFLSWVRLARERGVEFEWSSEIECARYFKLRTDWHRVLPDGRGVWHGGREAFEFVVELDRTRESAANLGAKFDEYFQWQLWRMCQRREEPDPNLLVVTTSWQQAQVISQMHEQARQDLFEGYPLWLTTFEALATHSIQGAIWQSNGQARGLQPLPCFVP